MSCHIIHQHDTARKLLSTEIIISDYVKSNDNVSDSLKKKVYLERNFIDHLREWVYGLLQVIMAVTLSIRLETPIT